MYFHQHLFGQFPGIMAGLSIFAFLIPAILLVFVQARDSDSSSQALAGSVVVSRGAAVIAILLWITFLYLRFKTHTELNESWSDDQPDYDDETIPDADDRPRAWDGKSRLSQWTVVFLLYLAFLAFCIDSFAAALLQYPPYFHVPFCVFGVPLLLKPMSYVNALMCARGGAMDAAIEATLGTGLCIALAIAPSLVIVGWIFSLPMTLMFGKFETAAYGVAVWLVVIFVHGQKSTSSKGALLVLAYVLIAVAFGIFLD